MSKEIVMEMWVSVIPDQIYDGWVAAKMIPKGSSRFGTTDCSSSVGKYQYLYKKEGNKEWKDTTSTKEVKILEKNGWERVYKTYMLPPESIDAMRHEVNVWYAEVFGYVKDWLNKNGFTDIKKGSFDGGFCAVAKEDETVKNWGAPLAGPKNKVAQIKEKYGRVTVYFNVLTEQERAKVDRFEKFVQKKFDCSTTFC